MVNTPRVTTIGLGLALGLTSACGEPSPSQADDGSSSSGSAASTSAPQATTGEPSTGVATTADPDSTSAEPPADSTTSEPPDGLRLHHAQVKGTHNSYHVEPQIPFDPSHEYTHVMLPEQLESQGVRAFELDVHRDQDDNLSVYHIVGIDQQTTCGSLHICLEQIKGWSDAHPGHLPIVIWLELKDDTGGQPLDQPGALQLLDDVVTSTFPPEQLITPDDVQGEYPTLRARLQEEGWPTVDELRGQVLLTILDTDAPAELYTNGYTTLAGRPLFVRAAADQLELPWAAIAKLGIGDREALAAAHAGNFLVATNVCGAGESDEECFAARTAAMEAGFHMLKDDFPAPVPDRDYWLEFPDGTPARCNPVTAPPDCAATALENL